jgi:hypothetical protein
MSLSCLTSGSRGAATGSVEGNVFFIKIKKRPIADSNDAPSTSLTAMGDQWRFCDNQIEKTSKVKNVTNDRTKAALHSRLCEGPLRGRIHFTIVCKTSHSSQEKGIPPGLSFFLHLPIPNIVRSLPFNGVTEGRLFCDRPARSLEKDFIIKAASVN